MRHREIVVIEDSPTMVRALRLGLAGLNTQLSVYTRLGDVVWPHSKTDVLVIFNEELLQQEGSLPEECSQICLCAAGSKLAPMSKRRIVMRPISPKELKEAAFALGFGKGRSAASVDLGATNFSKPSDALAYDHLEEKFPNIEAMIATRVEAQVRAYCEANFKPIVESILLAELNRLTEEQLNKPLIPTV